MITEILKENIVRRNKYLKKIRSFLWTPVIKVLIWARRVGKSSILKSSILKTIIQEEYKKWDYWNNFFYINKEDLVFDKVKNYLDLIFLC